MPILNKIDAYEEGQSLKKAENFLANLKKKETVREIVKDKLYYEQLQPGTDPIITINDSTFFTIVSAHLKMS